MHHKVRNLQCFCRSLSARYSYFWIATVSIFAKLERIARIIKIEGEESDTSEETENAENTAIPEAAENVAEVKVSEAVETESSDTEE